VWQALHHPEQTLSCLRSLHILQALHVLNIASSPGLRRPAMHRLSAAPCRQCTPWMTSKAKNRSKKPIKKNDTRTQARQDDYTSNSQNFRNLAKRSKDRCCPGPVSLTLRWKRTADFAGAMRQSGHLLNPSRQRKGVGYFATTPVEKTFWHEVGAIERFSTKSLVLATNVLNTIEQPCDAVSRTIARKSTELNVVNYACADRTALRCRPC